MESEREQILAQLRETERGEAAAWVSYPPTPAWWPFLFGAWTFLYAGVIGWLSDLPQAGAMLVLAVGIGLLVRWDRGRRGAWPTGRAPREIKRLMTVFFACCLAVAGLGWLVGETVGTLAAALVSAVVVTALVWWYGAAYDRAAAEVRERLG